MDYTLATIRRNVIYDMLDDEDFDPDLVDRAINRAQREIFNQFELTFMEKIFSGTIPEGFTMFKYPADLALAQDHVITAPDGTQMSIRDLYVPYADFNRMFPTPANSEPGPVLRWTSYGGNIILSRPTDQEYTLDVFYIKKPALLEQNGDVPSIPEEFGELLELGAYIRIAKRNEDTDLAQIALQDYAGQLNRLVDRYGFRKTGPIVMKKTNRR